MFELAFVFISDIFAGHFMGNTILFKYQIILKEEKTRIRR